MTPSPQPPLAIGPLISAALARVWHFKLEFGVMWLGYLLSALILLPYLPEALRIEVAVQQGKAAETITGDSGWLAQIGILFILLTIFQAVLMVLWMRVLRLGTALAFEGGIKKLALRTFGFIIRVIALLMVLVGLAAIMSIVVQMMVVAVFGQGTTVQAAAALRVALVVALILFAAITIRIGFTVISPIFDLRVPIERAWALVQGNTWRILAAIFVVCFPIFFAGSLIESAILRAGSAAQADGAVFIPGFGTLLAFEVVDTVINCLEIGLATAILIEAFERLGAWDRGRIVSEVV